jgi:transposase
MVRKVRANMHEGYMSVVKPVFLPVQSVADPVLTVKACCNVIYQFHPEIQRELKASLRPEEEYGGLKGTMWFFHRNSQDMVKEECQPVALLVERAPDWNLEYDLRMQLAAIRKVKVLKRRCRETMPLRHFFRRPYI